MSGVVVVVVVVVVVGVDIFHLLTITLEWLDQLTSNLVW